MGAEPAGPVEPPPLPLEVEELLGWLAAERGRSPNTLAAYRRDLTAYTGWLHGRGRSLAEVGPDDLTAYAHHLRDLGRAPATVSRALVAVRSLHRFCALDGLVDHDPSADLEVPSVPRGLPKALREDEVTRLLDQVADDGAVGRRDRAILEVLYGTGMRISELVGLSLADVDLEGGLVRVLGKGGRQRVVPLGRMARHALVAWLGEGGRADLLGRRVGVGSAVGASRDAADAVFVNQRGGRLSRQGAWGVVRRYALAAGLGDRLTPHVLRHSCATHMLDHGADIRAVQELLGHASISTTQVYTLVSTERLWQVYEQAHPRAGRRR